MNLRMLNSLLILAILLSVAISQPGAQTPQRDNRPRTASIAGRVTIGDAPAPNALVMVMEVDPKSRVDWFGGESQQRAFMQVRTNSDGRYRVTGLTEGAYLIRALSKAYVWSKNSSKLDTFKSVTLDDGESREDVDIALVRGGVITGRVIDAEGRPLIASTLTLQPVDENGKPGEEINNDQWMSMQTDDRGIYRIYGLPTGRYILSAGGKLVSNRAKSEYPQTFYPDATDQDRAKIIEVKEGAETTGIDIRLGDEKKTYEAAGRVIDAETGKPLTQVLVWCWNVPDGENGGRRSGGETTTDDLGRFSFTGLSSGRYDLLLWHRMDPRMNSASLRSNEHYSEKASFEIIDSDVSGLEIKAIRGSTISGVVVIEGVEDPLLKAKLEGMVVSVRIFAKGSERDRMGYVPQGQTGAMITGDGAFRVSGLAHGMAIFELRGARQNSLSIKRIERDGVEIINGFEIGRGEQITGVRIVMVQSNGTIRGQVEIVGGKLSEGWQVYISTAPIRTTAGDGTIPVFYSGYSGVNADEKGRFVIENLAAGEYELTLNVFDRSQNAWSNVTGPGGVKQRITVSSAAETPAKFILDLSRIQRENRQ